MSDFTVPELRAAYWALKDGQFATTAAVEDANDHPPRDLSTEPRIRLVRIAGASGGCGTTAVALAVAERLGADRLVEWATPECAGLYEAPTAELGIHDGFDVGVRRHGGNELRIERRVSSDVAPELSEGTVVFDAGVWRAGMVPPSILVGPCSVPGTRRLESALDANGPAVPVLVGGGGRGLPPRVVGAMGPLLRAAVEAKSLCRVPEHPTLRFTGITGDPLPKPLRRAAEIIVNSLERLERC